MGPVQMSLGRTTKDMVARVGTGLHERIFSASRGKLLGRISGMPVVRLTTTGRRSGRARTTMLTTPVHDRDRVVLVASYGGDDRDPDWFLNLRDNPDVENAMVQRAYSYARFRSCTACSRKNSRRQEN